jgi:uncharacterized protein (DUF169 family)
VIPGAPLEALMSHNALADLLQLQTPPIAIAFVDSPPEGVPRVASPDPAGCGYWRRAAAGEVFYTVADDHKMCPVGAHTHHVSLSSSEQDELMGLVKTMVGLSYLKMEDVPKIARRSTALQTAVYAPLSRSPLPPDVVLVRGNARQLMLLAEAAEHAGVAGSSPAMGRPTCAALPEAINTSRTAVSFGCIGNRVYTATGDTEAYFAIPGKHVPALERSLAVVVAANDALATFHHQRNGSLDALQPRA